MKSRGYLIKFGYKYFVTDDVQLATACLSLQMVEKELVEDKYIYVLKDSEDVQVESINWESVRSLTKEEEENLELKKAQSSADWEKKQNDSLRKQVEELKCQLKVALTKTEV